jgi:hypothetical protein
MSDKVPGLLDAIALVDDAITMAENALLDGPSKEEERKLNRRILRLKTERSVLDAELDAALDEETGVLGPSQSQIQEIAKLSMQVEQAKAASASVQDRIALTGKVVSLITMVVQET